MKLTCEDQGIKLECKHYKDSITLRWVIQMQGLVWLRPKDQSRFYSSEIVQAQTVNTKNCRSRPLWTLQITEQPAALSKQNEILVVVLENLYLHRQNSTFSDYAVLSWKPAISPTTDGTLIPSGGRSTSSGCSGSRTSL